MMNELTEQPTGLTPTTSDKKRPKSLIHKLLDVVKKNAVYVFMAAMTTALAFFLWRHYNDTPIPIDTKTIVADSLTVGGKAVTVANVQKAYRQSFKHLKKMDVYYREARDLLLEFDYAETVKKCDSALLCKIDKPLNWSPQKWGDVYNIKAESLLYLGDLKNAEIASINALKMDKQDKLGYLHLIYAQVLAEKHKAVTPLFMANFKYALKKNLPLADYMELPGFDAVKNDPSVKKLLK
jgi:tetratricopeptide (TPR) repeat protein